MDDIKLTIAKNIISLRRENNMTQAGLRKNLTIQTRLFQNGNAALLYPIYRC